ncbi:23S rRNA (guanosine(2251)-2'-O)-methyltransferase RlmB [Candidatus Nomurabacteria bacterium]|nr:23S rRNA (guanosine(2251)-2'-O)-methyltransferase RlmB [Candidatus Nomurabacteria bacterium]
MATEKIYLYGKHALTEALLSRPEVISKVFLSKEMETDTELASLLKKHSISISGMKGDVKRGIGSDAVHQGVIAVLNPEKLYSSFEDALKNSEKKKNPCIVLLDELHDPHNVGAIIRSAVAFGASAILLPKHNQAPITGVVIKTSAGMVFRIPIVLIGNVNQTIRDLKDKGYWSYGLVMNGSTNLLDAKFDSPTLLIVGNESVGIREKTLELCDIPLSIPMDPKCESLNAATATSIVLYEYSRTNLDLQ